MAFIGDILAAILTGYLALTNGLAGFVAETFDLPLTHTPEVEVRQADEKLKQLPSEYEYGGKIPDVLVKNAFYQQANALSATNGLFESSAVNEAVVNVYCEYRTDEYIRNTTGSGYFISPDGVIITNAHVAQFLLLEDLTDAGETSCVVRTGTTSVSTYEAELLYISPAWIMEHASLINATNPRGTGERDYALIYVTRRIDGQPLKNTIPALYADLGNLTPAMYGDPVTIGGYPSNTIDPDDLSRTATQAVASSSIHFLYTFGSELADLITLTGSPIGVSGVSGGPVVNEDGNAVGVIVTRGDDSVQGDGSLNAITLSYVNRTIEEETTRSLQQTITGDLPRKAKIFKDTMVPILGNILNQELQ